MPNAHSNNVVKVRSSKSTKLYVFDHTVATYTSMNYIFSSKKLKTGSPSNLSVIIT